MSTASVKYQPTSRAKRAVALVSPKSADEFYEFAAENVKLMPAFDALYASDFEMQPSRRVVVPSWSQSNETLQIAQFYGQIASSVLTLGDPYLIYTGKDPFEYRSVPSKNIKTMTVRLNFKGKSSPDPFPDE